MSRHERPALVSVAGTSRSGSTMIHLMLGSSSRSEAVGEALNWFRPVKSHHFELECACERDDCQRWVGIRDVPESRFHAAVAEQWNCEFVVDSSKELSWVIDSRRWAAQTGMDCINLFVWKDPLELAYSFWKRGGDLMLWRSEFLKYYRRVSQSGLPLLTVNLGDVLDNPQQAVARLAEVVGIGYEDGMERFWDFEHHHLFGNFGVRRQAQIGDSAFRRPVFSDEFEVYLPELRERINGDTEVQGLIERLREHDVNAIGSTQLPVEQSERPPTHPLPFWYYAQRAKRRLKRYIPEKRDRTQSHSVATIPVDEKND